jgi:hypothetical protein
LGREAKARRASGAKPTAVFDAEPRRVPIAHRCFKNRSGDRFVTSKYIPCNSKWGQVIDAKTVGDVK